LYAISIPTLRPVPRIREEQAQEWRTGSVIGRIRSAGYNPDFLIAPAALPAAATLKEDRDCP